MSVLGYVAIIKFDWLKSSNCRILSIEEESRIRMPEINSLISVVVKQKYRLYNGNSNCIEFSYQIFETEI